MKHLVLVAGLSMLGCATATLQAGGMLALAPRADLPSVESLLAAWEKGVGGREALDRIKTASFTMKMTAEGQALEFDVAWSRKGGRIVKVTTPMGAMTVGTDGTTEWMQDPSGRYMLAPEPAKAQLKIANVVMHIVDHTTMKEQQRKGISVIGKEKHDGKDCFKVHSPKSDDGPESFMFLDAATGIPVGSAQSDGKETLIIGDWKAIDGVKFPHRLTMTGMGRDGKGKGEMLVSLVTTNQPTEDHFKLPDAVSKLVNDKRPDATAPSSGAAEIKLEDLPKANQKEAQQMVQSLGAMELKTLKQMESSMSMGIDYMPEDKKLLMKFYVQEIRKEIGKRGG